MIRNFDMVKGKEGGPELVLRETLRPADKPKKHVIKCGVFDVEILVSEGQRINEHKICKRFLKKKAEEEHLNYKKLKRESKYGRNTTA